MSSLFGWCQSKTGVAIRYQESSSTISVVPKCHPDSRIFKNGENASCPECDSQFGPHERWEPFNAGFNVSDYTKEWVIAEWVAAWLGVPQQDVTVEIT